MYQFFKLPELVQHFQEHRAQDKELTVWQFFKIHYTGNDDEKDVDYAKDMKLPFKKHEFTHHITSVVIVAPVASPVLDKPPVYSVERNLPLQGQHFRSSLLIANIWQPPRA